ncbi:hypothetical protein K0M31_016095 [Melipona bicolor]|uniref:Uncharacterized protein n=1 Tax=Melipona bicolor TaxID=60889 RepID=A0AA40KT49_9HYME|nr:hypothetical protein K0M31_016095 [Melipona bicolor]
MNTESRKLQEEVVQLWLSVPRKQTKRDQDLVTTHAREHWNIGPGYANQNGYYEVHRISDQCHRSRLRSSRLLADEVNHETIADRPRSNVAKKHHRGSYARDRMERTDSSDLQQHIGERGRVETALTRLKTFYDTRGESEPIASLRLKVHNNLALLQRYEAIHESIIAAVDDDDDDEYYKLNNRLHWQQQQRRGALHRNDEVSPAKRNFLSPTLGGAAGLIGVKLDLLTNLPIHLSNGELLINNDAHKTSRGVKEKEEDVEIADEAAKAVEVTHSIHDAVTSKDITAFPRSGHTRDPENCDDGDDQRNASRSSHGIDHNGFIGGSNPPILELGVARRLSKSSTFRDDPSVPSTSRTPDGHFLGTSANTAGHITSSSLTAPPTAHQSHYRGVIADQFESSPTHRHVFSYKRIANSDVD